MQQNRNILYFLNGSIGDLLMVQLLMENMHANDASLRLCIVTPRNAGIFRQLLAAYPYIEVIEGNRRSVLLLLRSFIFKKNDCITPPTAGRIPLATKVVARLLSLRGALVGFEDGACINSLLYTRMVRYDYTRLYFDVLLDLLRVFNFERKVKSPGLKLALGADVLARLAVAPQGYIILHPFGFSAVRSILASELVRLVHQIQSIAPQYAILISGGLGDRDKIPKELNDKVTVIAGEVTMQELAILIRESALYIGVDTGVTHLASALNARSLVIAHDGASNWLPYYNDRATIVFQVREDESGIHEGREYLESRRMGRPRYLDRVPEDVINTYLVKCLKARPQASITS